MSESSPGYGAPRREGLICRKRTGAAWDTPGSPSSEFSRKPGSTETSGPTTAGNLQRCGGEAQEILGHREFSMTLRWCV
jgi:hypothetical protein